MATDGVDVAPWAAGTFLAALRAADRAALLSLGTRRTFRPGVALVHEGARDTDVFVLLDGCAKVLGNTVDGRRVLLGVSIAGDLVGELAAVDHGPRSASVVAATRVVARALDRRAFLGFLTDRPHAALAFSGAVVGELRRSTRHRIDVNAAPITVRLALVLDRLVAAHGQRCADGVRIEVPLSQPELASLIGVSEPSLQRALADLRTRRVVLTRYRRLVVCDPAALRALATSGA